MIICPNCHHQEYAGALFCSECATQLVVTEHVYKVGATDIIGSDQVEIGFTQKRRVSSRIGPGDKIFLKILADGSLVELSGHREFTIGRGVKGQLILPDVDLESYEAHALGVSRLHAVIKVTDTSVMIMDLGSSNGTFINGRLIENHEESVLNHGDIVALGKLEFEVLFDV
ncbi:MAG: FHA domain-containing protein [Anaerolineaceae bacterium]|nr:FHA domain-containing protein [Anaerolineaceae bacterium]